MIQSLTTPPMPLRTAQQRAEKILQWLLPFCERLTVAGSIRRERPLCNDIDIVAIPRVQNRTDTSDMFARGVISENLLRSHLLAYVEENKKAGACWKGKLGTAGPPPREGAQNLLLVSAAGVQIDVWLATASTWWTRLICRTGSMQHNIWAAERARVLGGCWHPYHDLVIPGHPLGLQSEQEFYDKLHFPHVEPRDRESRFLTETSRHLAQHKTHVSSLVPS